MSPHHPWHLNAKLRDIKAISREISHHAPACLALFPRSLERNRYWVRKILLVATYLRLLYSPGLFDGTLHFTPATLLSLPLWVATTAGMSSSITSSPLPLRMRAATKVKLWLDSSTLPNQHVELHKSATSVVAALSYRESLVIDKSSYGRK